MLDRMDPPVARASLEGGGSSRLCHHEEEGAGRTGVKPRGRPTRALLFIASALALFVLGLVMWFTAVVAWPIAATLVIVGVGVWIWDGRHS